MERTCCQTDTRTIYILCCELFKKKAYNLIIICTADMDEKSYFLPRVTGELGCALYTESESAEISINDSVVCDTRCRSLVQVADANKMTLLMEPFLLSRQRKILLQTAHNKDLPK